MLSESQKQFIFKRTLFQKITGYIYPNPSKDFLNIKNVHDDYEKARIVDVLGSVVFSGEKGEKSIDVRGLRSGIYLLIIQFKDGEERSIKFIKE